MSESTWPIVLLLEYIISTYNFNRNVQYLAEVLEINYYGIFIFYPRQYINWNLYTNKIYSGVFMENYYSIKTMIFPYTKKLSTTYILELSLFFGGRIF